MRVPERCYSQFKVALAELLINAWSKEVLEAHLQMDTKLPYIFWRNGHEGIPTALV